MASKDLDQTANKAEFDRLMTAATVYRRRGDYVQATLTVKQALGLFPDDLDAREFAADMIYAHGDIKKASEYYKSILKDEPERKSTEEKYAKAILELAEADRQRDLIQLMVENPRKFRQIQPRNSTIAVLLSIAPGFGHIYCGQYITGLAIFAGWVLSWLFFFWTLGDSQGVQITRKLTAPSVVFASLAASLHIYSLIGAAQQAEKTGEGKAGKGAKDQSESE